jgi:tyrosine-protein kinase Etk/Wzc
MNPHAEDWNDEIPDGRGGRGGLLLSELLGRWHWIALMVVLGWAAAWYYLAKAPKLHEATATLLVKQQSSGVLSKDVTTDIDLKSAEALNTVVEQLKRPALLERVGAREDVRALDELVPARTEWLPGWLSTWLGRTGKPATARPVPDAARLAGMIRWWMEADVRRGTRLIDIAVRHPSPAAARLLANAIARESIAELEENLSSGRNTSIEVLARKSDETRASLQAAQNAHASYLRALDTHQELETKEKEQAELARRYLSKHPKMITVVAQVRSLQERFLKDFEVTARHGADSGYWKQAGIEWDAQDAPPEERIDIARRLLLSRTAVLKSEIESQEKVFNAMLTKMQETDVNQAAGRSEVEISSTALMPDRPVSPVARKVLALCLSAGAALGAALAWLLARIDNKLHTVADVEALDAAPVLGAMSQVPPKLLRQLAADTSNESSTHAKQWSSSVIFRESLSSTSFAEMIRVVRASVSLLGPESQRKVTLFTSAIPGEGKSFISANFALAAAAQGKRVLLMDFDLRKPSLHKVFGIRADAEGIGVSGCLSGQGSFADAVIRDIAPHLDLMPSGRRAPNPGELLGNDTLPALIAAAAAAYDVVVIDTAPVLAVPDARLVARHAHNVCLVARADYTARGAVTQAADVLASGDTKVSGIVFNGYREKRRLIAANHSYGYYAYGRRGRARQYGGTYGAYGSDR